MEERVRTVTVMPATLRANLSEMIQKENVTYYARVSTDMNEQEESYEKQREYFENYIKLRPEWNYVEGYADQGISGTKAQQRPEFMRMIEGTAIRTRLIPVTLFHTIFSGEPKPCSFL